MNDRYRGYPPAAGGRSATFNPARASLPTGIGYTSLYAGDMHAMSSANPRQYMATPRGHVLSAAPTAAPAGTRTYTAAPDNLPRPSTRESSRTRRSTLDSASRPPVIITTTTTAAPAQKERPHAPSSHSSNTRAGSPVKDEYRSSDGQFYAQPSSSIRSRSTARPYHATSANQDFSRIRDRGESLLSRGEIDAYRSSRPSVVYANDPRHSTAPINYGDDGYQYTTAGELARYDLDHPKSSRPRRHDSVDKGYYRPNVNYNADQRSFNVNTSHDLSRNYNMNTSRPYDGRGGPPPSTRGFDKINRVYDPPRDVPPAAPIPPPPTTPQLDVSAGPAERREAGRRSRPLSLHQDGASRSSHRGERYRSREDERNTRQSRDRERERERDSERAYEPPRFKDDGVAARGFGIRTDLSDDQGDSRERRRESRLEEPKSRHDEAVPEERRETKEGRKEDDGDDKERSRLRGKVAASSGVAATAVGLAPPAIEGDKKDHDAREPKRLRSPDEDRERRKDAEVSERHPLPERGEPERDGGEDRDDSRAGAEATEHHRREAEAKLAGGSAVSSSDSDDARRPSRRHRPPSVFDPNDASDLKQLKEQLAAMDVSDRDKEGEPGKLVTEEQEPSRSASPAKERRSGDSSRNESRGRELAPRAAETKQVRVVSPPREKPEEKPLRGILKQPSPSFPEEANPVREGVAPHKEDKKMREAPPGARWTKINRKIVNPEALTIGKERFEVRPDFVIVLRVLSKEEIQAYATATQLLRERRRSRADGDRDRDREREHGRDQDGEGGRRHRYHRHRVDGDEDGDRDRDHDRERRRRHRRDDEDEYEPRLREPEYHPRFRERDRVVDEV